MKLFIDIVMKRIYLFNIVARNYTKEIGFPVCKNDNFAGLQAHRKRGKSARASPTPHHTLNEERRARFTAQPLSALDQSLPRALGFTLCAVVLLHAARVFDYFVVIEIAFMDNQAQITETISRLDSEKVR